ncbi:PREDICTED: uncharacterized protein LOC105134363 [Populus euphratica]|uniref:Uncharacterized protein LOC105134363 n=1 Tax=Populus euphratica TaxID=75702 RepID=A0AAJ6UW77_POPEU|nr:PREDICTED: uncharacterized protein LOC105134363 [Populus euphratica]
MAGGSDPFQRYFEEVDGGLLKCIFCEKTLAGSTSTTRMKYHLARVRGGGVKICEKVSPHVQQAAFGKLPDRMRGSMPSSSNNIIVTADSDPAQDLEMQQQGQSPLDDGLSWMYEMIGGEIVFTEENAALGMHMPDAPETGLGIEPAVQAFETDMNNFTSSLTRDVELSSGIESRELMRAGTERGSCSKMPVDKSVPSSSNSEAIKAASTALRGLEMEQEEQPLSDERGQKGFLIGGETELVEEPRAPVILMPYEPETRQRTEQAHQSFEMNLNNISSSSMRDFELRIGRLATSPELMQSVVERQPSSKRPVHKKRRTGRYVLPTTKLVGQAMERNMKDVWSWLLNDEVSCIGIWGMGGVGKTALATHIHNQLQEKPDIFPRVCWISVPQDFSVHALQDLIAEAFGLYLGNGKDLVNRAGELWTTLSVTKCVLIIDNLWNHFPLDKVGIPLKTDGCKLILTTRSLDTCRKMDCRKIIKLEPLFKDEAWDLFKDRLGRGVLYPEIAESIVKECDGLPLGIITMARSMKGVDGEYRWRDALLKLRRLEVGPGEMEANVFRVLKFSYAQLNYSALQECFLRITLFPKGKIILREDLIEYLIDEGIVKEMVRRHAQFDRGHTMLDELEEASLLEGSRDDEDYRYVKMHDLIWDMAWKILNESGGAMVQAGAQLTELPDVRLWREELLRASLMENRIENIPTGFSPMCPRLSTLLLCRNYKLNLVEDSFFQHLIGLKVLDLSDTDIEKLPESICHLTSLAALLLGWCAKLSYVPSLAELTALEKLDLSYTGLEDLPEGMERLEDLRYLNLDGSGVRVLRSGILPQLSKLQFLKLHQKSEVVLSVRGDEVSRLHWLETLECNFRDLDDLGKTALATHIHNQLQEKPDIFPRVCWISVPQDFSVHALQDLIAEAFGLYLENGKDLVNRAGELWTTLSLTQCVLIIDNLWNHFPLDKVGIPLKTDGCKLILTTRSLDTCRKMDCRKIIKLEPLFKDEAWDLFKDRLGRVLYPEIAESIVKECDGLPLGIITMARSMKGVDGEYRWRDALLKLRRLEVGPGEMEANVFRVLKFSYAQLNYSALQECFLRITLFPKGKIILREDLIEYLIDEGIVKEMVRRHAQFDRGHTMLDELEEASLLEGSRDDEDYRYVKMHDLIWDMAWKILNESGEAMVQAGAQLTELPDVRLWREELLRASLMENRIENIPTGFSPMCPRLSTLLLCRNYKLNLVEDSFFQHLIKLKVLDLSDTDIEKLPESICHLTSLAALLLGWCAKLSYVPSLAELTALKKLNLSYTGLEDLPEGMERLRDLRYLNLDGSGVRVLRSGILPKLLHLEFLKLHQKPGVVLSVSGHEVSSLHWLETLECNFRDLEDFRYFRSRLKCSLIACKVTVGRPCFSSLEVLNYTRSKSGLIKEAWFYDLMIDNATFLFPGFITKAVFVSCQNMRTLCPCFLFVGFEILHLDGLIILETLSEVPSQLGSSGVFYNIREIVIHKCHRMKVLLPPWLLDALRLEVIVVEDCYNMQEIMGSGEVLVREKELLSPSDSFDTTLRVLVLKKLPNLNSIYSGSFLCNSLEEITVGDCPQLTRIPFSISHSLKKIEVDPESLLSTVDHVS